MYPRTLSSMLLASAVALFSACAHSPKSYSFQATDRKAEAMDALLAALASKGIEAGSVDRNAGSIVTRWIDTGYRFREIDDGRPIEYYTDIFLRHRVSVTEVGGKIEVALDTDVQRCAPLDAIIVGTEVQGSCQPLSVVFPAQQKQIDQLGDALRAAVAGHHTRA